MLYFFLGMFQAVSIGKPIVWAKLLTVISQHDNFFVDFHWENSGPHVDITDTKGNRIKTGS